MDYSGAIMSDVDYKVSFGEMLKSYRKTHGYTQEEFAYKVGMYYTYYGKIERGENSISLSKIESISKVIDTPISEMFKRAELMG